MKAIFEGIEDLFVNVLFVPYDLLRFTGSWWTANFLSCIFILIGGAAFIYWMLQLREFDKSGEEENDLSAHTYL
ncbi:MAG: uracil phosphoribosyltransferase [Flavobacteriaceae bacterium]